ncbi:MAG TPA: glutamate-cysteine ligase family protein, partial [Acidimicrobiia bacterium]|nr:glutamate-cysteine ligase family protein [Acidimicrobiia bacterium]
MPARTRVLDTDGARRFVAARGFEPAAAGPLAQRVGIEAEWLTVRLDADHRRAPLAAVRDAASACQPLPAGSRVTFEPGGQIELSTRPLPGVRACDALATDAAALGKALAGAGIGLVAVGLDPGPEPEREVRSPRYDAMEAYFDLAGPAGRTMMRSTAAVQVNVDLGPDGDLPRRWRLAHHLGPVLAAAFANSPFAHGAPSGYRSTRLAVWRAIDPSRTRPVGAGSDGATGCRTAWADYALGAGVMLVRADAEHHVPVLDRLSFADWIERGHELGWPTLDDLDYHLTTLFPPVRPRGWLELRMIDGVA